MCITGEGEWDGGNTIKLAVQLHWRDTTRHLRYWRAMNMYD